MATRSATWPVLAAEPIGWPIPRSATVVSPINRSANLTLATVMALPQPKAGLSVPPSPHMDSTLAAPQRLAPPRRIRRARTACSPPGSTPAIQRPPWTARSTFSATNRTSPSPPSSGWSSHVRAGGRGPRLIDLPLGVGEQSGDGGTEAHIGVGPSAAGGRLDEFARRGRIDVDDQVVRALRHRRQPGIAPQCAVERHGRGRGELAE